MTNRENVCSSISSRAKGEEPWCEIAENVMWLWCGAAGSESINNSWLCAVCSSVCPSALCLPLYKWHTHQHDHTNSLCACLLAGNFKWFFRYQGHIFVLSTWYINVPRFSRWIQLYFFRIKNPKTQKSKIHFGTGSNRFYLSQIRDGPISLLKIFHDFTFSSFCSRSFCWRHIGILIYKRLAPSSFSPSNWQ